MLSVSVCSIFRRGLSAGAGTWAMSNTCTSGAPGLRRKGRPVGLMRASGSAYAASLSTVAGSMSGRFEAITAQVPGAASRTLERPAASTHTLPALGTTTLGPCPAGEMTAPASGKTSSISAVLSTSKGSVPASIHSTMRFCARMRRWRSPATVSAGWSRKAAKLRGRTPGTKERAWMA